jgi:plasmid stabilization system protein ParE
MRPASISGRAEADLTNQYRWYCDNAGEQVAERFLTAFDSTVKRLAEFPGLGRLRRFRILHWPGCGPSV